jgi:ABC-type transport system involved in Fe-S cluster assembly fused permease/ATPase subunit
MMVIEAMIGRRGGFYISLLGLVPTIVIISLIAFYGVAREGWHYACAVALGGLLWGVLWLLTSKMKPQSRRVVPLEYE